MGGLQMIQVLWPVTVIFIIAFTSYYLFIALCGYETRLALYRYDDHVHPQIGIEESIDFSALKPDQSIDSVLLVFKDDPEICAALNGDIKNYRNFSKNSLIEHSTTQIKKNKINKTKYKNHSINSNNDTSLSPRKPSHCNHTSHATNISINKDNICSTVTPSQSTYPLTRRDNTHDLLNIRFHAQLPLPSNKVLKRNHV